MSTSEREALRSCGWLSRCPSWFQDTVLARGFVSSYAAGDRILDVGDPPGGVLGVISGQAGVSLVSGDGVANISHILRPCQWFGASAVLARDPRRVRLEALSTLRLFTLPIREIDAILDQAETRSSAWRPFALLIIQNSEIAVGVAQDLMIRDVRLRCIAVLLRLSGYRLSDGLREEAPSIELSQGDLAYLSNLSRNAVGAILADLKKQKIVSVSYRQLQILNPRRLMELFERGAE